MHHANAIDQRNLRIDRVFRLLSTHLLSPTVTSWSSVKWTLWEERHSTSFGSSSVGSMAVLAAEWSDLLPFGRCRARSSRDACFRLSDRLTGTIVMSTTIAIPALRRGRWRRRSTGRDEQICGPTGACSRRPRVGAAETRWQAGTSVTPMPAVRIAHVEGERLLPTTPTRSSARSASKRVKAVCSRFGTRCAARFPSQVINGRFA